MRLIQALFAVGNSSSTPHNTSNTSPTVTTRATFINRVPPLPRRNSSDSQGTAPPPYAPQDPEPATPPAVPPRDRPRTSPVTRSSNSGLRATASAVATRSPPTVRPPTDSPRLRPRSDPVAPSTARTRRAQNAVAPPPSAPATNVGGFRAEMPPVARTERPELPARHNGARTSSPTSGTAPLPRTGSPRGVPQKRRTSVEDPLEYLRR